MERVACIKKRFVRMTFVTINLYAMLAMRMTGGLIAMVGGIPLFYRSNTKQSADVSDLGLSSKGLGHRSSKAIIQVRILVDLLNTN